MTPEWWQRVKEVFQQALDRAPEERSRFLASASAGDESLRKEVESLLASHEKEGSFIDSPAYAAAEKMFADEDTQLKPGEAIGSYEIISFITRGGMGEVYLAQDRRLSRKVALKLLPASFTQSNDRLRRFEQEARTASALNHPNILTIHEIGETNGRHFLATEFIEGETLRHRLTHAQLTIPEALHIAVQIADALTAAHKAGIIHRDIKPENVMIRPDGYVKVVDFGLAKLAERASAISMAEAPTKPVKTASGMIIGTVDYMSPEQARGLTVDARSDIFSLGVVIYEMVAHRKPFEGETVSDTLAAILKVAPTPVSLLVPETPAELVRIVSKALRKDREERYQVVKDMLLDLKSLKEELDFQTKLEHSAAPSSSEKVMEADAHQASTIGARSASTREIKTAVSTITHSLTAGIKRHKVSAGLLVSILAVVIGGVALNKFSNGNLPAAPVQAPQVLTTTQITFSSKLDEEPSLSPDGNSVAYASDESGKSEIYIKQLAPGGREIQLTNDGQQNSQPVWSPDGQRIAYYSQNRRGIWVIPALGGVPKQLADFGSHPSWSRDGSYLAFQTGTYTALPPSTIWIVSAEGGTPKQITYGGSPSGGHGFPSWSPDGSRLVFTANDWLSVSIWSISAQGTGLKRLAGSEPKIVPSPFMRPVYSVDGASVYYVGSGPAGENYGLWRIQISNTGEFLGESSLVMAFPGKDDIRSLSFSANGKMLAFASLNMLSTLTTLPISTLSHEATGPPAPLTNDRSLRHVAPAFSHDGRKIAFGQFRAGQGAHVWLIDPDGKNLTQLTTGSGVAPSWFPDGDRLEFLSDRSGYWTPWSVTLASGKETLLYDIGPAVDYVRMSPDGKRFAFNSTKSGTINISVASLESGEQKQLTFDKERMGFPCWSPDGNWLAFEMKRGEDQYLAIMPSDGGTLEQLVSDHGLSWPHDWSRDGDKIVFSGQRDGVWNIYWVSRSTKQEKQLTHYSNLNAFVRYPAWSPLGNQIVYEYVEWTGNVWLMELK